MSYMKSEFDNILRQYGHNIYLQRRDLSNKHCESFFDTLEIHTVRHMASSSGLTNDQQEQMEGITNTSERVYFFRSNANPKEGDRIYEADPSLTQTVWVIDSALPMRGLNGDLEFWAVGTTRIRPN